MKVIKQIKGRPMICHMIDRLKLAERVGQVVICTSTVEQDDPLERIATQESVNCFRGEPDDVLRRLTDAAQSVGADIVVNCTADNPFVDPEYIERLVDFHVEQGNDFSKVEGLPFGAFSYVLSYSAMVRACELKAETDTEVWGGYFTETNRFKWSVMPVTDPKVSWPELRLTVDTPEDFELVERIFDELYQPGQIFSLAAIVDLCRRRPDLAAINAGIQQKAGLAIRLK